MRTSKVFSFFLVWTLILSVLFLNVSLIEARVVIQTPETQSISITTFTGNLTNLSQMEDTNIPSPANDEVLTWSSSTSKWIAQSVAAISKWIVDPSSNYLYNDSTTFYFNETQLNETINLIAVSFSDNSSWNESYADSLYYGILNPSNYWNDTYATFNESYADTIYILQSSESDLNVNNSNTTNFWAGISGFVTNWLFDNSGNLDFNETKLNNTVDLRAVTTEVDPLWSGNQSSYLNSTQLNDTFLKTDGTNNMTGVLTALSNITHSGEFINTSGSIIVGDRLWVGSDPSETTLVLNPGDVGIAGILLANNTISSFPRKYGVGLSVSHFGDNSPGKGQLIVASGATLNTTTGLFCDFTNSPFFVENATSQIVGHLLSTTLGSSSIVFEVLVFINSSCVTLNLAPFGSDIIPDLTLIAYGIGPSFIFTVSDNGFILAEVGTSPEASFKIKVPNATGSGKFFIDSIVIEDNTNIVDIKTDTFGQKAIENFRSFMFSSQAVTSATQTNMKIEADLANYSNGSYTSFDLQLLDSGINNDLTAIRVSSLFDKIVQIGIEEDLSMALYDDKSTIQNTTAQFADSSSITTIFENDTSIIYLGNEINFTEITISLSSESSESINPSFFYCNNSNEWESLDVSDGTFGFTKAGTINFNNPINRGVCNIQLNGSDLPCNLNHTYIAIQRNQTIVNVEPEVKTIKIFSDSSSILIGNTNEITGAENAFGFVNSELQEEGGISFYVKAKNADDNDIVNAWFQVGKNNSASGVRNSYLVMSDRNATESQKGNLTFLSNAFERIEQIGIDSLQSFDSTNLGADLFAEYSIGTQKIFVYDDLGNGEIRVEGDANFFMEGNNFDIFNGSLYPRTPRQELVGFAIGELVLPLNENFEDGDISPFVQTTSGGGASEWTAISSASCHDGICARAIGGSLAPLRIMQTNFSTSNLDTLNISFWITTINTAGADFVNVTINNNVGSGDVELFSTSAVLTDQQQNVSIPASMDNKSTVSLNYIFSANVANEIVYIDEVIVRGTATANTQANVTRLDTEILVGDGSQRIFWNDSTGTLELPGNVTIISAQNGTFNQITLGVEAITNWDNVSSFDENVLLVDGSRSLTSNWNQGAFNLTNTLSWFLGKIDWSTIQNKFSGSTTDDLTEGSSNLYDNQTWNESYADTIYILQSNEGNLNVNGSNYWDDLNDYNTTQMENNGGTLNIILSWFSTEFDSLFGAKDTDDLTEGSSNLYDNQTWNESLADSLYYGISNPSNYWNDTYATFNESYADTIYIQNDSSVTFSNIVSTNNITTEQLVLENNPDHRINDNSTCTFIYGSTSRIEVC